MEPKDHPHIHKVYHQTASSASSIQHTHLHFISPYSVLVNTILLSLRRCLKRLSWGTLTKTAYAFLTSPTCCISHLLKPPLHNHPHNNRGRVPTMKPIICNFLNPLTQLPFSMVQLLTSSHWSQTLLIYIMKSIYSKRLAHTR
jgi:hypothetical protein